MRDSHGYKLGLVTNKQASHAMISIMHICLKLTTWKDKAIKFSNAKKQYNILQKHLCSA